MLLTAQEANYVFVLIKDVSISCSIDGVTSSKVHSLLNFNVFYRGVCAECWILGIFVLRMFLRLSALL